MKHKATTEPEFDPNGPLLALLQEEIDGLAVHDQDFVVCAGPPERHANWLAVDREGRLVLVFFVEAGDETVATMVLSALACAADSRAAAAKRWPEARVRTDLEPHLVLVATSFTTRGLRGLSFLAGPAMHAFELGTLTSAGGVRPYLIRRELGFEPRGAPLTATPFSTWPATSRADIARLAHDISRIDPEIERRDLADGSSWFWHGTEIAHAASADGRLVASGAHSAAAVSFDDRARREAWVEQFLTAHCTRRAGSARGARPLDLLDRSAGPLLSAEELDAFRD